MSLLPASRLGPYEVISPLGAGGMGEVWKARDTRLDRTVAIKVLPEDLAQNADALARFEREAKAVATLSHPNILAIYDFGRDGEMAYAVTEYLDGETLRARLSGGALPVRKAVDYAVQISRGLAAAHEQGIVHRDLKPENVFVTRDGQVKILDFGLAKQFAFVAGKDQTSSPTVTQQTEAGVVLGTVGYMSPEQVRGEPADARSDIFSLGVVFYEMLAGRRAFSRDTSVETMTAILKEDPPAIAVSGEPLAPSLERILRGCLEKNPRERFQSARDLGFALEAAGAVSRDSGLSPAAAAPRARRTAARWIAAGAVLLALGAAVGGFAAWRSRRSEQPVFTALTFRRGLVTSARFTPDGHTVLYGAAWEGSPIQVFSTRIGSSESMPLALPAGDILSVSPSGELAVSLGRRYTQWFMTTGRLARASISGGAPRELLENVMEASWAADGERLLVVRDVGRKCRLELPAGNVLFETAGWISHARLSPRGDLVAFIEHPVRGADNGSVSVVSVSGKAPTKKTLTHEFASTLGLVWHPSGKEIWFTGADSGWHSTLRAVTPAGKERLILRTPVRLILHDMDRQGRVLLASENVRVGTLVGSIDSPQERDVSWLDSSFGFGLSADGKRILINEQGEGAGAKFGIYIRGVDGSPAARLGDGFLGALSDDGRYAATVTQDDPPRVMILPAGVGEAKSLPVAGLSCQAIAWFPDGRRIALAAFEANHGTRLYSQEISGGAPKPFSREEIGTLGALTISPDGKFAATLGPGEIPVIVPTAGGDAVPLAGLSPGDTPIRFSRDGQFLYSDRRGINSTQIVRLDIERKSASVWKTLTASDPTGFFQVGLSDITPDGRIYASIYARVLSELFLVEGLR